MAYNTTEEQATAAAEKLLARMETKGWAIRVWENLGWCYCLTAGSLAIHENPRPDGSFVYSIFLSDTKRSGGGMLYWSLDESCSDPNKAVQRQMNLADVFVDKVTKVVEDQRNLLGLD